MGSDFIDLEIYNVNQLQYNTSNVLPDDKGLLDATSNVKQMLCLLRARNNGWIPISKPISSAINRLPKASW